MAIEIIRWSTDGRGLLGEKAWRNVVDDEPKGILIGHPTNDLSVETRAIQTEQGIVNVFNATVVHSKNSAGEETTAFLRMTPLAQLAVGKSLAFEVTLQDDLDQTTGEPGTSVPGFLTIKNVGDSVDIPNLIVGIDGQSGYKVSMN